MIKAYRKSLRPLLNTRHWDWNILCHPVNTKTGQAPRSPPMVEDGDDGSSIF